MSNDISSKVIEVISKNLGESKINEDSMLSDLGLDDLDMFELLLDLEDAFDINIKEEDFRELEKIKDIIFLIERIKTIN